MKRQGRFSGWQKSSASDDGGGPQVTTCLYCAGLEPDGNHLIGTTKAQQISTLTRGEGFNSCWRSAALPTSHSAQRHSWDRSLLARRGGTGYGAAGGGGCSGVKRKDRSNLGRGWGDAERERKRGPGQRLERRT